MGRVDNRTDRAGPQGLLDPWGERPLGSGQSRAGTHPCARCMRGAVSVEIRTQPCGRGRRTRRLTSAAIGALIVLTLVLLAPVALGLQRHTITDSAMGGSYDRGTLVFGDAVPVNDLRVGDVITYTPPANSGVTEPVTRRITAIHNGTLRTRADGLALDDPWNVPLDEVVQSRVMVAVPYAGYVFIGLANSRIRLALALIPLTALLLVGLARRGAAGRRRPLTDAIAVGLPLAPTTPEPVGHPQLMLVRSDTDPAAERPVPATHEVPRETDATPTAPSPLLPTAPAIAASAGLQVSR